MQQLRLSRMYTIGRVKRVEESKWDIQPRGMNNTIRWLVGHIFVTVEMFTQQSIKSYEPVNQQWFPFFEEGTSPSDWEEGWEEDVPSGEELLAALRGQLPRIIPVLEDKLHLKMTEPLVIGDNIMTIDTIEGLVQFLSWHEAPHAGTIDTLNRCEDLN